MALYTKTGEKNSAMMKPTGSGIIDVVNDFSWTLSNNKAEVPVAYVTEYQINSGQLLAGMYYYAKQIKNTLTDTWDNLSLGLLERGGAATKDPYKFMYFATPTEFNYVFPWLGDTKFSRTNDFNTESGSTGLAEIGRNAISYGNTGGRGKGKKGKGIANTFRGFAEILGGTGAAVKAGSSVLSKGIVGTIGLNSSKSWAGTSGQNYIIEFDLINTFNNTDEIRKNRELAFLLTYQNSPFRRNFAVIDPVCIYQLSIPDVVHFPACYVSDLSVTNIGNTRSLKLDGETRTIPEGYAFSITFSSLLEESRNIFGGVDSSDSRIEAISDQHAWDAISSAANNTILTPAKKILSGLFEGESPE